MRTILVDRGGVTAKRGEIVRNDDAMVGIDDRAAGFQKGAAPDLPAAIAACEIIAGPSHSPPPAVRYPAHRPIQ